MVPYLLNAIFKVNSFPESSPSFWMRSGACDRSDPDVAIKAYNDERISQKKKFKKKFRFFFFNFKKKGGGSLIRACSLIRSNTVHESVPSP